MTLEELEAKRAAMRASRDEARKAQKALDLEAILPLEEEYGDRLYVHESEVFVPGLPVLVAMRLPNKIEFKRYQDLARRKGDTPGDPLKATNLTGDACLLYPARDVYAQLLEASPGIHAQAAAEAIARAAGKAEDSAKS